jgi:hypothetical protein
VSACAVPSCPALASDGHVYCVIHRRWRQVPPSPTPLICRHCQKEMPAGTWFVLRDLGPIHAKTCKSPVERAQNRKAAAK